MHRAFVVAALSLSLPLTVATGQETRLASIPAQVTALQSHLDKWENSLTKIDIGTLSVSYKEGKPLDENRSLCLEQIRLLKREIRMLKGDETLLGDVRLILSVDDLQSCLVGFSSFLTSISPPSDQHSQETIIRWARESMSTAQEIEGFYKPLHKKLFERLNDADEKLSKCGGASPKH